MRGTEKWLTKAAVVTGLVVLFSAFGADSAVAWAVTADTPAYSMDGLPSVLDESVLDESVSGGSGTDMDHAAQELDIQDEMEGLQQFLDEVMGQQDGIQENFPFQELMKELVKGNLRGISGQMEAGIQSMLFSEVRRSEHTLFQAVAIGTIGTVFSDVSSVFRDGQISDTRFSVTYILFFTCLVASFMTSLQVMTQVLGQIPEFMRLMMPAYFMSMVFSGENMSTLALCEGMLGAAILVQWICSTVLLPMVKTYVLMVLGSYVVKEAPLAKLMGLLEQAVGWGLGTPISLVVGLHLIQSMILPYVDTTGQAEMERLLEIVPGLGREAGAMTRTVLGSGVLIKNTMGAATVAVLAVITVTPIIELMAFMVLYQCVAAVVQPVCDKWMVSCVSGVSKGHKLSIQIVLYSMFLFVISIAITCASTNVNYFTSQSLNEQSTGWFLKLFK